MRHKLLFFLLILLAGFFPAKTYAYSVYIQDDADLLTDAEEASLEEVMVKTTEYGNAGFVTIDENDNSAEYYAMEYCKNTLDRDGIIFLIDMDNRMVYIYSMGEIEDSVTTAKANTITDNVYKLASREEYYQCALKAFKQINAVLDGKAIAQPMKYIDNLLIALVIALIINFLVIYQTMRAKEDPVFSGSCDIKWNIKGTRFLYQTKKYSPKSDSGGSGSGSGGGGGGSGGGGSGGGHSF